MPGIGGLEATHRIKAMLPKAKILILSLYDSAQIAMGAKNAGADGVISKTEVIAAIENLLRR